MMKMMIKLRILRCFQHFQVAMCCLLSSWILTFPAFPTCRETAGGLCWWKPGFLSFGKVFSELLHHMAQNICTWRRMMLCGTGRCHRPYSITAAFTVKSQPSSAISISQCISKRFQKHTETTTHTIHVWPRYLQGGIPGMTYTDEIKRSQEALEGTHSLWRTYSKECAKKNIVEQPGIVNYSSEILFIRFSGRTLSGHKNSE